MEKARVTIAGKLVQIEDIKDQTLDYQTYTTVTANSAGFQALVPKMTDECMEIVWKRVYQPNSSSSRSGATYNDAIIRDWMPELIKRLRTPRKKPKIEEMNDYRQLVGETVAYLEYLLIVERYTYNQAMSDPTMIELTQAIQRVNDKTQAASPHPLI